MKNLFTKIIALIIFLMFVSIGMKSQYIINTIAGNGFAGYSADSLQATASGLHNPIGIAKDAAGNTYISDYSNNRIRKVDINGMISTIAGNGINAHTGDNGFAINAQIYNPTGLVIDAIGSIYFCENGYNTIRKIDTFGIITTIAGLGGGGGYTGDGGLAINARLNSPYGLAIDNVGNLYFADRNNHCVRKITSGDTITTLAGRGILNPGYTGDNGLADSARLQYPSGVAVDNAGNVFIADTWNNVIRKVNVNDSIFTIAGSGTQGFNGDGGLAVNALLNHPYNVAVDTNANVFVADFGNNVIRVVRTDNNIYPIAGSVQGFFGDGGLALSAKINGPISLFVDATGTVFFGDFTNNRVRTLTLCSPPTITTSIIGSNLVCPNSVQVFSINLVAGALTYTWALPTGWTGSSTTNSITATVVGTASGFVRVTANSACGVSNTVSMYDSVNSVPAQPTLIFGNTTFCQGSAQVYAINGIFNATDYTWTMPNDWTGASTSNSINATAGNLGGIISVTANNSCGSSVARTLTVAGMTVPQQPNIVTGPTAICINSTSNYSVGTVIGATGYAWSFPSDWTGSSNTENVTATAGIISGNVVVTADNTCGSSTPQTLAVTVVSNVIQPGIISGNANPCNLSTQTYSIAPVPCANDYIWSFPSGWSGSSTTNSITLTVGSQSGVISVMAHDNTGNSLPQTLNVTVTSIPAIPASITGNTIVCQSTSQAYSVTSDANASSYVWTLPNGGWAGTSTINTINTTAGNNSGTILVSAINACGISMPQNLAVTVNTVPPNPGIMNGNTNVTVGSQQTYFVNTVPTATSYNWLIPNSWTGNSSTNTIITNVGPSMGTVAVYAVNVCGNSVLPSSLPIYVNTNSSITNYLISTIAGDSIAGYSSDNVVAVFSSLDTAVGVAKDAAGNIYVADYRNHRIRKVDTYGIITTIAGTGTQGFGPDGVNATLSKLSFPTGVAVDAVGNVYIADNGNNRIRKINASNNIITTLAGNTGTGFAGDGGRAINAYLNSPYGIALDNYGNIIFGDRNNHCVRKIGTNDTITTIAGKGTVGGYSGDNGPADSAKLQYPSGVAVDVLGNIYIADTYNDCVRKISTSGIITTIANRDTINGYAGDGDSATHAHLNAPYGVAVDVVGNVFIADGGNNLVRKISTDGIIHPIAGTLTGGFSGDNGIALAAKLKNPISLCVDAAGVIYVGDCFNNRIRMLSPCSTPTISSSIVGDTFVCPGSSQLYSIDTNGIGATFYSWSIPIGWSGVPNFNSILVTPNSTSGNIQITASNICGSSSLALPVHINDIPAQPGPISGNSSFCNGSSQTFSVPPDSNTTSYTWSTPTGWTGNSTTTSITATVHDSSGFVHVYANNVCGSSLASSFAVTVNNVPPQPGIITGPSPICAGTINSYTIANVPTATSYNWTLPLGWTGSSSTTSIASTAGANNGNILVSATNNCGTGFSATLPITVNTIPATPGSISGSTTVCANTAATYTIHSVPCASGYSWTLPNGWTGSSTDTSITLTAGTTGGTISVTANNTYGSSSPQTLTVNIITIPSQPTSVIGNTSFCQGTTQIFSVASVIGATNYSWTIPGGWTGSSTTDSITIIAGTNSGTILVTANNVCGASAPQNLNATINLVPGQPGNITGNQTVCQGTTVTYYIAPVPSALSYIWTFPGGGWSTTSSTDSIDAIVGSLSGQVRVQAVNACGTGPVRYLAVSVTVTPAQPGAIIGTDTTCTNISHLVYSITPVTGATSYHWSVPSILTLNSGQGTYSITVTAGNAPGNGIISVRAVNSCDSSSPQTLHVYVFSIPQTISTPPTGLSHVCRGSAITFIAPPNPDATFYTWNFPSNWSGNSTTDTLTVTIGNSSGMVQLVSHNQCGSSSGGQLFVNVDTAAPPKPVSISGPLNVCQNSIHTYKTPFVSSLYRYVWSLPSGWAGTSFVDSIVAVAGLNGGIITVGALNACDTSQLDTITVISHPSPSAPTISTLGNFLYINNDPSLHYQWFRNDTAIVNDTTNSCLPTLVGYYTVRETNAQGCSVVSSIYYYNPSGIIELSAENAFLIRPNPNNGTFTLYGRAGTMENATLLISDILGRPLFRTTLSGNETTRSITILQLDNGIYHWELINAKGRLAKGRLVIIN